MRIVNITQRYAPAIGGAEMWCTEICRYLAANGHAVQVLTLAVNEEEQYWRLPTIKESITALGPLAYDHGVSVRRYARSLPIDKVHHGFYRRMLDEFLGLYAVGPHSNEMYGRMYEQIQRSDIVFLHTMPYPHNFLAFLVAKVLNKATLIVPHFHPDHLDYERPANYWLLQNCDGVLTVTDYERRYLIAKGVAPRKIHVTGNGVHVEHYLPNDLESFRHSMNVIHGLQPTDFVVTFIGRKTSEKGLGHLIEAVRELPDEINLRLFLVGPGYDWFAELYSKLSDKEKRRIIDMGVVSHQDKVNLLHLSDLMALPSKHEAFGIVYLEGWICGAAVLGTDKGAPASIIGNDGYLTPFGNTNALKAALRAAMRDKPALKAMASRGRARVIKEYTWNAIGKKVHDVIPIVFGRGKSVRKVLVVANAWPPNFIGGAELVAWEQARLLREHGHEVSVFAGELDDTGTGKRYSVRDDVFDGIPVRRICLHGRDYSSEFCNFFHEPVEARFKEMLDDFSPDLVHAHNIIALSVGVLRLARHRKIATVLTLHDFWGICLKNTLIKQPGEICADITRCAECLPSVSSSRWTDIPVRLRSDYIAMQLMHADAVICPSDHYCQVYRESGLPGERLHTVANGVDVERFAKRCRQQGDGKLRFTVVGHLGWHKGVLTVLDALMLLGQLADQVILNFVGDGEARDALEQRAKSMGRADIVRFWGQVPNDRIEEVYRVTDVMIMASIWPENRSCVVSEAMASRIPVIASRIGAIPELISDGVNGYLFEPGNADDLAGKMTQLIRRPELLVAMGNAGLERIAGDTFKNQFTRIMNIYDTVLAPRAPAMPSPDRIESHSVENELGASLVVCAGKVFSPAGKKFVASLDRRLPGQTPAGAAWRVVMSDWIDDDEMSSATAFAVIDDHVSPTVIEAALRNHLPLLVPEEHRVLTGICREFNCGLYYADAIQAKQCLEYVRQNPKTRVALGRASFRAFHSGLPDRLRDLVLQDSSQQADWDVSRDETVNDRVQLRVIR